jgi:hypothetical protein
MTSRILGVFAFVFLFAVGAVSQVPWINVPMINGATGQYACVTRPTNDQSIAVITCNPQVVNMYPPFAQVFLIAHEHGHVYQIVYTPQILMTPYAEYDADCYAATYMVSNDPQSLALSIQWFRQVLGPYGGDAIHGNGFQMAQRAQECAQAANPRFEAELESHGPRSQKNVPANAFLGSQSEASRSVSSYPKPKGMSKFSTSGFPEVRGDVEPTACTALEFLLESSHTSYWEASDETGRIAPTISKALGANCRVDGLLRRQVECKQDLHSSLDLRTEIVRCLSAKEWEKHCDDASCTTEILEHPGDGADHVEVSVKNQGAVEVLELVSPIASVHTHDSKSYASIR